MTDAELEAQWPGWDCPDCVPHPDGYRVSKYLYLAWCLTEEKHVKEVEMLQTGSYASFTAIPCGHPATLIAAACPTCAGK